MPFTPVLPKRIERSEHEQLRCNGTLSAGGIPLKSYALCALGWLID